MMLCCPSKAADEVFGSGDSFELYLFVAELSLLTGIAHIRGSISLDTLECVPAPSPP